MSPTGWTPCHAPDTQLIVTSPQEAWGFKGRGRWASRWQWCSDSRAWGEGRAWEALGGSSPEEAGKAPSERRAPVAFLCCPHCPELGREWEARGVMLPNSKWAAIGDPRRNSFFRSINWKKEAPGHILRQFLLVQFHTMTRRLPNSPFTRIGNSMSFFHVNPTLCWLLRPRPPELSYLTGVPSDSAVKNPPANAGDMGSIPGSEDPLEKGMATHSSILAWRIPWTEERGRLQSMG